MLQLSNILVLYAKIAGKNVAQIYMLPNGFAKINAF